MTFAIVNVLPDPVTPRSVWKASPSSMPSASFAIASGWSPDGGKSSARRKGLLGNVRATVECECCSAKPTILDDERSPLTLFVVHGADGTERSDPWRHRAIHKGHESEESEPRRRRLLRRQRKSAGSRVREARRSRAPQGRAALQLPADRRPRRV